MKIRQVLDYGKMMEDRARMQAYAAAITALCPGRTVCEVGLGLGPLSLMALRAGAKKVYGVELDPEAVELATRVIRANGFDASRFEALQGLSMKVELPEKVDVLISETLDSMGIGENTALFMNDAKRFLKDGGVFLPSRLDCYAALASPAGYRDRMTFWNDSLPAEFGLEYGPVAAELRAARHTFAVTPGEVLSGWERWQTIDFAASSTLRPVSPLLFVPTREGEVLGLAWAFDATLAPGVKLRTFPEDAPTHWQQGFHAFPQPVRVRAGDVVYVELHVAVDSIGSLQLQMNIASGAMRDVEHVVRQRLAVFAPA
jgi:protein arginine N-methyltransferase 1